MADSSSAAASGPEELFNGLLGTSAAGGPLVCPACGARHGAADRLCARCGTPLVPAAAAGPPGELRERARKVRAEYASGPLVRVAGGRHQAEAEFVAALLLEEGIPSLVRRSAGFDVPDYLAAGPRDVLVPASGAEAAHEVLLQADLGPRGAPAGPPAWRILLVLVAGLALIALLAVLV